MPFPVLPVLFGAANAGLGLLQGQASANAQRQQYLNEVAYQKANSKFANWQAEFNAERNNANSQYQYWVDTLNHNQSLAFTNAQRNVELMRGIRQAESVAEARAAAGASYVQDSEAINAAYGEAEMQQAVAMQQYRWRALQARASVQAMGMEGRSVDRLVNDYSRQEGDMAALQEINSAIRGRQLTRQQAGAATQYLTRWNSQQFYEEQQYMDPVAPFPPLPTLITPAPPSMTGAPPSSTAQWLNAGTAVMGGVQAGIGMNNQLNALKIPSGGTGPGTPQFNLDKSFW